ncbi:LysR family transcriptional regulator [Sphingomonas sp. PL-96]|uniref:LysR substrate-binding domain-containing protein n=1 Tax=Sphingomonas sp. PL-96 TaxID=2887201 RepID=UPI001E612D79|nr:LysR substrate-binding domain-containing protein [Sphingomonas sp. PL-96]MCC2978330.1 LysR family transcriptional regulator [Sphingomonas sp. PL-96]
MSVRTGACRAVSLRLAPVPPIARADRIPSESSDVNFRQLEIYRALMIGGSASRAADLLGISQPAVSRAVADLEHRVGFPLFDRIKGRLIPTPEGELFFKDVHSSFLGLDHLRASAARIRDFGSGNLKIASLAALGSTVVPRAVRRFRDANPKVSLTLQILSSAGVRDHVVNKGFDIGLAADEVDLSGVDHSILYSVRAVCVLPPDHPLASRAVIRPEDLHDIPFLALAPEDRARMRINEGFDAAGVEPHVIMETPASLTICALALQGVGVGLVNPVATDGFEQRGLVIRPYEPPVYFKAYMLFRPDAQRAQLVREFAAALNDTLRAGRS